MKTTIANIDLNLADLFAAFRTGVHFLAVSRLLLILFASDVTIESDLPKTTSEPSPSSSPMLLTGGLPGMWLVSTPIGPASTIITDSSLFSFSFNSFSFSLLSSGLESTSTFIASAFPEGGFFPTSRPVVLSITSFSREMISGFEFASSVSSEGTFSATTSGSDWTFLLTSETKASSAVADFSKPVADSAIFSTSVVGSVSGISLLSNGISGSTFTSISSVKELLSSFFEETDSVSLVVSPSETTAEGLFS
mmetsp:Transcript_9384/g.14064  ORF Transcript_9384/g.14064 Transcript_9384/m.14064 type:complete len:251 (-) Transcript_9384:1910-2662(-)